MSWSYSDIDYMGVLHSPDLIWSIFITAPPVPWVNRRGSFFKFRVEGLVSTQTKVSGAVTLPFWPSLKIQVGCEYRVDILQRGDEMDCWIFAEVEFAWQHSHWKPGMLWGHKHAIAIAFGLCFFFWCWTHQIAQFRGCAWDVAGRVGSGRGGG